MTSSHDILSILNPHDVDAYEVTAQAFKRERDDGIGISQSQAFLPHREAGRKLVYTVCQDPGIEPKRKAAWTAARNFDSWVWDDPIMSAADYAQRVEDVILPIIDASHDVASTPGALMLFFTPGGSNFQYSFRQSSGAGMTIHEARRPDKAFFYGVTVPETPFAGSRPFNSPSSETPAISKFAISNFVNSFADPTQAFNQILQPYDPLRSVHLLGDQAVSKFLDLCVGADSPIVHKELDSLIGNAFRLSRIPNNDSIPVEHITQSILPAYESS